jgi:putative glycerol-1-phosphate prenyltransferase
MDAGSGAKTPIPEQMIHAVSSHVSIPLVIGGGIRDAEKAYNNCKAGADLIVIGNAIEKDPLLVKEMSDAIHSCTGVPQI